MKGVDALRDVLEYNPETGVFTYCGNHKKAGQEAGSKNGEYMLVSALSQSYPAHRLAWYFTYGEWPDVIDHINRDKRDNRLDNLRNTTWTGNRRNLPIYSGCSKIPVHGVNDVYGWYFVTIGVNRKQIRLGRTKDFFEACCLRKSAEVKYGYHRNHGADESCLQSSRRKGNV